jgi:cell wall-associated NlpC family hydrolase
MAVSDQEMALRLQVVSLAVGILQSGTHYYWGAPDSGVVPLTADDFSADPTKRHVLAASTDGTLFCAGRCDNPAVRGLTPWTGSNASALPPPGTTTFRFPRYYKDGDRVHPSPSAAVFGESCVNKMHFDCASFVRYCFRQVLGTTILPLGITMKSIAPQIWPTSGGPATIDKVDILPADIVYTAGEDHVGMATGNAAYIKIPSIQGDQSIHAYYAKVGVIQTLISGPDPRWGVVRRWKRWTV